MLAVALVVPPQLLGGIDGWAIGVTALLALAALGAAHWAIGDRVPVRYGWPLLAVMLGLVGWTALQALPLPCSLVEALAPDAAEHVRANRALAGDGSTSACTLSRDPGSTQWEVAKGIAIAASFLAAWLLTAAGHRQRVLMAAGASVLAMALVGLAHLAVGAEQVFGLYEPRYGMPRPVLAPLLNPNHLAGFLAMGVPILGALALAAENRSKRAMWLVAAIVPGVAAVLTLSRGGLLGLLAGVLFLGSLILTLRSGSRRRQTGLASVGLLLALILGAGAYLTLEPVARELGRGNLTKLELIRDAGAFALDHPWLGVGRGAFAAAYVQPGQLVEYRAEHPESFPVQWAAEWGIPAALLLIGVLGAGLLRGVRQARSQAHAGALAAVISIAAHDLVDFSLELVGVAVVAAAVLGAAVGLRIPRLRTGDGRRPSPAHTAVPVLTGGLLLLLLVTPTLARGSQRALHDDLVQNLERGDRAGFEEHLARALRLHPSDPIVAVLAATEAVRHGDRRAPAWLNRAMSLAPSWPAPHLLAAKWLWARGARDQAMVELRAAAELAPGLTRRFICDTLGRAEDASALIERAAPRESALRAAFLEVASTCLTPTSQVARRVDRLLLEAQPRSVSAAIRVARRQAQAGDAAGALSALQTLAQEHPHDRSAWLALAGTALEAGELGLARQALGRAERLEGDPKPVLRLTAQTQAREGDLDAARTTLQRLRGLSGSSTREMANALDFEGDLWRRTDHIAQALRAYDKAHRIDPSARRLEKVARTAEALGDRVRALRAYLELCQTYPDVARYCDRRQRLEQTIRGSGLGTE
ncbi:MAG: O-antigen ligase family protein [Myxococcota bacterium]